MRKKNDGNKISNSLSGPQNLNLKNRRNMEMSGVNEVISFNEDRVVLQTTEGILNIRGKELNIEQLNLDDGKIKIAGLFFSLEYSDKKNSRSIINKLFK
ncbi:MAG: sporulation protein YabP [Halanaerobiaceae bacterium]